MARRSTRSTYETVAQVNGFAIDRDKRGAAVYWHAIAVDADDYQVAARRDCGSKAEAILFAETYEWPRPDRWIGRIAAFDDRDRAQAFADLVRRFGQPRAYVGALSGALMTSDNSPSVFVGDDTRHALTLAGVLA